MNYDLFQSLTAPLEGGDCSSKVAGLSEDILFNLL
jgi:hypothetical protein